MSLNRLGKEKLLSTFGNECLYCCCHLTYGSMTVEHLLPVSFGGKSNEANLAVACSKCNNLRGNKDFYSFIETYGYKDVILCKLQYINILRNKAYNKDLYKVYATSQYGFWKTTGYKMRERLNVW